MRTLTALTFLILASGCATLPVPATTDGAIVANAFGCATFLDDLEARLADAGVLNAGAARISGFPGLRTDRFLASFAGEVDTPAEREVFVAHLRRLDARYRRHEIALLHTADAEILLEKSDACGQALANHVAKDSALSDQLLSTIEPPDHYVESRRIIGAYPLIRPFMRAGVSRWQREAKATFSNEPPEGRTVQYWPSEGETDGIAFPLRTDPLGIPMLEQREISALFARHAPVFEVASAAHDDRIGTVKVRQARAVVDVESPSAYRWLSFTRFDGAVLPQLNYIVWFPARTRSGPLDLYGGRFDGLNLRVTLDTDGVPLLFESIHNCGCYYRAYPTARLRAKTDIPFAEPPLILSAPPLDSGQFRVVVSMTPVAHYVNAVYAAPEAPSDALRYEQKAYDTLFSLPGDRGAQSLFDARGLVPGSERLEGYLLWPSGVLAPGAMRQWGTHAIAFIGERHFDDPAMLDAMFQRSGGPGRSRP